MPIDDNKINESMREDDSQNAVNSMWGGRFSAAPDILMDAINVSIDIDRRLYAQDIAGSIAHCRMLAAQGIISESDGEKIVGGLERIRGEINRGEFPFSRSLEDIHMNIESRLGELIGAIAGRLHTARSRNDQVVTDFRLYLRAVADEIDAALRDLQHALASRALEHHATIMPGFTHLQNAQAVTFGHHCLAYVEMFGRDRGRFSDARHRLNESPLGAGALAGSSLPIDREMVSRDLGFSAPMRNSLDAVSARDFVLELLSAAAIASVHLSRLADELVLWASAQFRFIRLPDWLTTGSSMMPQKRNPDAAELVRAKSGAVIGHLVSLLVVMKGLPLAYSKDMQEDKRAAFESFDVFLLCVRVMTAMIRDLEVDSAAMRASASVGHIAATDLADWFVRILDIPFREAHHKVGLLVAQADERGCEIVDLPLPVLQAVDTRIGADIYDCLSLEHLVSSRVCVGGTAPDNVRSEAERWLNILGEGNRE